MPWIAPAIIGGAMLAQTAGSMYSANQQGKGSDAQREAMRREIELGKNQALINSQSMAPYTAAGYAGLQNLFGLSASGGTTSAPTAGSFSVPVLGTTGTSWKSPTTIGYQNFTQTGAGIDPTGGAAQYRDRLAGVDTTLSDNVDATGGAGRYLTNYANTDTTGGAGRYLTNYANTDVTGGAGNWMQQLAQMGKNFKFNENDPAYRYKLEQATKAANENLAARGMYNSRAGLNLLDESGRAIMSDEYDKQYGREYSRISDLYGMGMGLGARQGEQQANLFGMGMNLGGRQGEQQSNLYNMAMGLGGRQYDVASQDYQRGYQNLMDLFNMSRTLGATEYSKGMDLIKIGQGSASSAGALGNQSVGNIQTGLTGMANVAGSNAAANSANIGGTISSMGAMPMNYAILQRMLGGSGAATRAPSGYDYGTTGSNWYDYY
jgi:hypothetical protein